VIVLYRVENLVSTEMQTCPSCGELVPNEYVTCVWCGYDLTAEHIRRAGITIGNSQAIERMRRVVVDPLKAFKEISLLPDLRGGKMILYAIGVMITFNMIAVLSKLKGLTFNSSNPPVFIRLGRIDVSTPFVLSLAFILIQPLVLFLIFMVVWKISARVLALMSKSFGGKGDREKIRAVVGYSMLPIFFGWTLAWLIRLIAPAQEVQSHTYQNIKNALVAVSEQGFGVVSMIFIYIGWIWAVVLGIIGMKNAGRLSWIEAIIVAGIPYGIFMSIAL